MCDGDECRKFICGSIFFFKQKTAYEMRISDWSSDVCSSDLRGPMEPGRSSECNSKVGVSLGNILAGRTMADFRHFLKNPRPPFARIFLGPISPDLWNRSDTNRNKTGQAHLQLSGGPEGFPKVTRRAQRR